MRTDKILITGAGGQLGTVLTKQLQEKHGFDNVIASDLRINSSFEGCFEVLDVTNFDALKNCVLKNEITQIYHLVAILSAKGEEAPLQIFRPYYRRYRALKFHPLAACKLFWPDIERL